MHTKKKHIPTYKNIIKSLNCKTCLRDQNEKTPQQSHEQTNVREWTLKVCYFSFFFNSNSNFYFYVIFLILYRKQSPLKVRNHKNLPKWINTNIAPTRYFSLWKYIHGWCIYDYQDGMKAPTTNTWYKLLVQQYCYKILL